MSSYPQLTESQLSVFDVPKQNNQTQEQEGEVGGDTPPATEIEAVTTEPPQIERANDELQTTADTNTQAETTSTKPPTPVATSTDREGSAPSTDRPTENIPDTTEADDYLSALANEIHRLTNDVRTQAGVPTLAHDTDLATIATKHSEDMALRDYFSHTSPNGCDHTCRFKQAEYLAKTWGENIAWYSADQLPSATKLATHFVDQWLASSGHRRNILSRTFTHQGIGLASTGNKIYATVNFAKPQ